MFKISLYTLLIFGLQLSILVLMNALPFRPPQRTNENIWETQTSEEKEKLHQRKKDKPNKFTIWTKEKWLSLDFDVDQSAYIFGFKSFSINNIKLMFEYINK